MAAAKEKAPLDPPPPPPQQRLGALVSLVPPVDGFMQRRSLPNVQSIFFPSSFCAVGLAPPPGQVQEVTLLLLCPQNSGRRSRRRAATVERRDRTRPSPVEMTSTCTTTRSAPGQVGTEGGGRAGGEWGGAGTRSGSAGSVQAPLAGTDLTDASSAAGADGGFDPRESTGACCRGNDHVTGAGFPVTLQASDEKLEEEKQKGGIPDLRPWVCASCSITVGGTTSVSR